VNYLLRKILIKYEKLFNNAIQEFPITLYPCLYKKICLIKFWNAFYYGGVPNVERRKFQSKVVHALRRDETHVMPFSLQQFLWSSQYLYF